MELQEAQMLPRKMKLYHILIDALMGGAVVSLLEDGVPVLAATKESGKWIFKKIQLPR